MRITRRSIGPSVALLWAIVACTGCHDPLGLGDMNFGTGGRLVSITVYGPSQVHVGDTVRFTATGQIDGLLGLFNYDPVRDASWSSSEARVGRLETAPPPAPTDTLWTGRTLVRGIRPGTITVTATARRVRGTATLTVVP